MDFEAYAEAAERTDGKRELAYYALGLVGEAGEFAERVKKVVYHGHELTVGEMDKMRAELGDVLWYLDRAAAKLGLGLEAVAAANVLKLEERYPEGYSDEASRSRDVRPL